MSMNYIIQAWKLTETLPPVAGFSRRARHLPRAAHARPDRPPRPRHALPAQPGLRDVPGRDRARRPRADGPARHPAVPRVAQASGGRPGFGRAGLHLPPPERVGDRGRGGDGTHVPAVRDGVPGLGRPRRGRHLDLPARVPLPPDLPGGRDGGGGEGRPACRRGRDEGRLTRARRGHRL